MPMPKITRLDDPNNPYNVKRTPTSAPPAEQKARNKAKSDALRARSERAAPAPAAPSIMQRANREYMEARKKAIDKQIARGGG